MEFLFLPRVTRTHYPFLDALLSLRRPYGAWLDLVAGWRVQGKADGLTVRYITVSPHELRRHLPAGSVPASFVQLLQFTAWVGHGRVGSPFASPALPGDPAIREVDPAHPGPDHAAGPPGQGDATNGVRGQG